MNMKKLGLALSLTATFALLACGDSSSSTSGAGGDTPSCKVTSDDNSVTMTSSYQGQVYTQKVVLDGNYFITTTTMKGMSQAEIDEECEEQMEDNQSGDVTCDGNVITSREETMGQTLAQVKRIAEFGCDAMEGGDLEEDDGDEREDPDNPGEIDIPYNVTECSVDTSSAEQFIVSGTVDGVDMVAKIYMDGDFYVSETTLKDAPKAKIDEYCAKTKAEASEDAIVTCEGDVVTSKTEDPTGISYAMARGFAPMMCSMLGAE